jgi:hypothetical protein
VGASKKHIDTTIYKIIASRLPYLTDRLEKLNKKARKLGLAEITSKVLGYYPAIRNLRQKEIQPACYEVQIVGEFPKLSGWSFIGTIEHTEAGNILRAAPNQTIPDSYRHSSKVCDHCGKSRTRKDTYIIQNLEASSFKQVGHSCIKDFLGGRGPEAIAFMCTFEEVLRGLCGGEWEVPGPASHFEIREFLSFVVAEIAERGYFVSAAKAREEAQNEKMITPTSERACASIFNSKSTKSEERALAVIPTEEHCLLAENVIEWAKSKIDLKTNSSYFHNLAVIAHKEVLNRRDLGLAASAVAAYQREMDLFTARAKTPIQPASEYFGVKTERAEYILILKKQLKMDSDWGTFYIYIFEDELGNKATWKSTVSHPYKKTVKSGLSTYQEACEIAEGAKYRILTTIKGHAIYKDEKQTLLSRLVVMEELSLPAAVVDCKPVMESPADDSTITPLATDAK